MLNPARDPARAPRPLPWDMPPAPAALIDLHPGVAALAQGNLARQRDPLNSADACAARAATARAAQAASRDRS